MLDVNASGGDEDNDDNRLRFVDERSVHFPRIGKRAYHNLLWANGLSNPHRMLDGQGRYFLNGYDYQVHQKRPQSMSRYRGKRDLPM